MSLETAARAEQDVNSYQAKQGLGRRSDSVVESGVDEMVERKWPDSADAKYGEVASTSAGDHRKIPPEEGGDFDDRGRMTEARHFEGPGGPEDKARLATQQRPGDDDTLAPQELKRKGI